MEPRPRCLGNGYEPRRSRERSVGSHAAVEFEFVERRGEAGVASHPVTDTIRIGTDLDREPEYTIAGGVEAYVEWPTESPDVWDVDPDGLPWETA